MEAAGSVGEPVMMLFEQRSDPGDKAGMLLLLLYLLCFPR
jgi:hypothetical protein